MGKIKTNPLPTNLLFFDTETYPDESRSNDKEEYHKLNFGYCIALRYSPSKITARSVHLFKSIDQFWKCIRKHCSQAKPLYVFSHNLGFDLTQIDFWRFTEKAKMDVKFFTIEDPPNIFSLNWDGYEIRFLDTLNYFRMSLKKLGESVGLEKLECKITKQITPKLLEYCLRDCEILEKSICQLLDFLHEHKLGGFANSQASMALKAFRASFNTHEIHIHDNLSVCQMERGSYYGGLVHNFFIGKAREKPLFNLDINSLYPAMMLKPVPIKMVSSTTSCSVSLAKALIKNYACVAKVKIESSKWAFPIKFNGKLLHVLGRADTHLCGPELEYALNHDLIIHVHQIAWYHKAVIFADFINYFWELRKKYKEKHNDVYDIFCKIFMNSLYGKFGQRSHNWQDLTLEKLKWIYDSHDIPFPQSYNESNFIPPIAFGMEKHFYQNIPIPYRIRRMGNKYQIELAPGEHAESFPLIAAYITSYGRMRLRELIGLAGNRNVYYADTDSLFVNSSGYNALGRAGEIDSTQLGKLKLEKKVDSAVFYCPKDYEFGDVIKRKGIRHDAKDLGDGNFEVLRFEGIKSVLARDMEPYILIERIIKKNSRQYHKGLIGRNGWTKFFTFPLEPGQEREIVLF